LCRLITGDPNCAKRLDFTYIDNFKFNGKSSKKGENEIQPEMQIEPSF